MESLMKHYIDESAADSGNKETVLQDFQGILKQKPQIYLKIMKKCVFVTGNSQ